jgi:hypothetical protein
VEWVGLVLLVAASLGALPRFAPHVDGWSYGGFLAHRLVCAVRGHCDDGEAALARAYGTGDAELVRRYAPNIAYEPGERSLPVDFRRCRSRRCADAPDDRRLDAHRTASGQPATAFVRVLRRGGRRYVQYWLYYPDSNTTWAASDELWDHSPLKMLGRYPGFHRDDWEGFQLRIDPDGSAWSRATTHRHYQGCKQRACRDRWVGATGWTRVSRGSHAGHVPGDLVGPERRLRLRPRYPGVDMHERTTTAEDLRLVPLEPLRKAGYRPLDPQVRPPWRKEVYRHPDSDSS